jgi:hypothetical protein
MQSSQIVPPQGMETRRATYASSLEGNSFDRVIARFAALTTPSWLEFQPGKLWLHLERGQLVGARGAEPLGQILIAGGAISEISLAEALRLQGNRPLGLTLTDAPFHLPQETVRRALERQVYGVLDSLALMPPERYNFYRAESALPLHPRVPLSALHKRDRLETDGSGLPLGESWRMGAITASTALSPDEWALCRLLNGRRTLQQAIDRFSALEDGVMRARAAARSLIERGLLEPSAVAGLRTIVVARKREIGASYHPPAGMIANLFLRQLNGLATAYEVMQHLKIEADRAASLLTGLYRDHVVDVVRGHLELSRLLEDY